MIKNYVGPKMKEEIFFELEFDIDEAGNGYSFPCDQNGVIDMEAMGSEARENYKKCLSHPEHFVKYGEVVRKKNSYMEPAKGVCRCGTEVHLEGDASQCPCCGRWYNVYGQELLSPDQWEED